jgi:acyl-homoserine lactone acylase PvdQ
LKKLMVAWAEGLNLYLAKHPEVKPRVITKWEPWMALSFTEGSIGGDIETISVASLGAFYGRAVVAENRDTRLEPTGSNGMAIAPKNTKNGRALLLINPHTSFYFRSELQMTSGEGLNAYGAATWGQFFIYQGFNENTGWMHTSSGVDNIDEYLETVIKKADGYYYRYGAEERKVTEKVIAVPYKTLTGMAEKKFTIYYTHRGPVVREEGGKWVTVRLMVEPVKSLTQSYLRTKVKGLADFQKVSALRANSSNNTLFADRKGNVGYFHANFLPRRNDQFDFTRPVDGSDVETDWKGVHELGELPALVNPASGWVYNANDWPWMAGGEGSLEAKKYPKYTERGGPSARGKHARMVLGARKDFTLDGLVEAAYDSYLPWFEEPVKALGKAWEADLNLQRKARVAEAVGVMTKWDGRWGVESVATALGVYWAEEMTRRVAAAARARKMLVEEYLGKEASREVLLEGLEAAMVEMDSKFGTWKKAWGEINRFQRLSGDIEAKFDDGKPSLPVGFTSGTWGSLAVFGARPYANTRKWYGTRGNSFVAVVEFGPRVKARAVSAGGESGDVRSKHFADQAERYVKGDLRAVWFYPEEVKAHAAREYVVE